MDALWSRICEKALTKFKMRCWPSIAMFLQPITAKLDYLCCWQAKYMEKILNTYHHRQMTGCDGTVLWELLSKILELSSLFWGFFGEGGPVSAMW